jgi:hypothetical protein
MFLDADLDMHTLASTTAADLPPIPADLYVEEGLQDVCALIIDSTLSMFDAYPTHVGEMSSVFTHEAASTPGSGSKTADMDGNAGSGMSNSSSAPESGDSANPTAGNKNQQFVRLENEWSITRKIYLLHAIVQLQNVLNMMNR